jgi:hypothetical protein
MEHLEETLLQFLSNKHQSDQDQVYSTKPVKGNFNTIPSRRSLLSKLHFILSCTFQYGAYSSKYSIKSTV